MTKRKPIQKQILYAGERIDYEDLLLSRIGRIISKLNCIHTIEEGSDSGRDYFTPDCDYEIIIRPKK
jgi:hypothetical protein